MGAGSEGGWESRSWSIWSEQEFFKIASTYCMNCLQGLSPSGHTFGIGGNYALIFFTKVNETIYVCSACIKLNIWNLEEKQRE